MNAKPREDRPTTTAAREGGQVIAFRPRTSEHSPHPQPGSLPPATEDRVREKPDAADADDFKQRMLTNVAAFLFLAGLTGAGIWLAASISDLRRTQDCVLANRPNCAQIVTPAR